jgi:hypothetical protein
MSSGKQGRTIGGLLLYNLVASLYKGYTRLTASLSLISPVYR